MTLRDDGLEAYMSARACMVPSEMFCRAARPKHVAGLIEIDSGSAAK
jgi:hypothetical protein